MNLMVAICRYTWFLGITIWFCMVRRTHLNKNKDKTLYRISNFTFIFMICINILWIFRIAILCFSE